jgi:uncharacterized hydrophobic protein (TIGR00271 family)
MRRKRGLDRSGLGRKATLEDSPRLSVDRTQIDDHLAAKTEIAQAAQPSSGFFLMNLFAAFVASYGLLADSAAVVIGAMVIAVLLGPIAGIGLSLVISDRHLFGKSLSAVALGTLEVLGISYLIGSIHELPSLTSELLARTQPNLFDLMIALAGGAAGAYAVARRVPGGSMIGVAIATALVPPLCTVGIAASYGQWQLASGALVLFFSNFVAIQTAYSFVLLMLGFRPHLHAKRNWRSLVKNMWPSLVIMIGLAIFLGSQLEVVLFRRTLDARISSSLRQSIKPLEGAHLADVQYAYADTLAIVAAINTPEPIAPEVVASIEQDLVRSIGRPLQLSIRSILVKVANRERYLFEEKELEEINTPVTPTASPLSPEQLDSLLFGDSVATFEGDSIAKSIVIDTLDK